MNVIKSFVTLTLFTRASTLTAVLTPSLLNPAPLLFNDRTDLILDLPAAAYFCIPPKVLCVPPEI